MSENLYNKLIYKIVELQQKIIVCHLLVFWASVKIKYILNVYFI